MTAGIAAVRIVHSRTSPIAHRFAYRGRTWLIDLDDPPALPRALRPFARFLPADHFPQPAAPGDTLRSRLDDHLRAAGITPPGGPVRALMSPRVAGYVFNPLSVFWCHHPDGSPALVVAEVHNTYRQRHCYVVNLDDAGRAVVDKQFYVSPFHDVSGSYRLHLPEPVWVTDDRTEPQARVSLSITLDRPGAGPFVASMTGIVEPATPSRVALAQVTSPLAPLVVSARIRIQGIRLWMRRLPIIGRPSDTEHTTVHDTVHANAPSTLTGGPR